jgi:rfaE bifunctional protein kinase chain/domain
MNSHRLQAILDHFPRLSILVVGDFFLDKYLIIEHALGETSLETGLEAHQVVAVRCSPGAAGTVTSNLRAMEVNVIALSVIGDDGEGYELKRALQATGVNIEAMIEKHDRFTPTYTKPMLREPDGSAHELSRLDIKNHTLLPAEVEDEIIARLQQIVRNVEGVIIADQVQKRNCGVITDRVRDEIATLARAHPAIIFAADSRERIGLFRDVIIKPNAREATRALRVRADHEAELDHSGVEACGAELARHNSKPVFLTIGADGIIIFHAGNRTHVPAYQVTGPIDTVGAGDAAMAGIVAALCSGADLQEAALVGNLAAAVTIRQIGTTGAASRRQIAECLAHAPTALSATRSTTGNKPTSEQTFQGST